MEEKAALLIVDVQNDFCPGGVLAVPGGDRVIDPINRAARQCAAAGWPVLASRDWHPPVTRHFRPFGGSWPLHCLQDTPGAAFHPDLHLPQGTMILSKGTDPERNGYSAFEGVTDDRQSLMEILRQRHIERLYLCGLATDFCVLFTAREALRGGFKVTVLKDAVAGVDVLPGDAARALEEMAEAGVELICVGELLERLPEPEPAPSIRRTGRR